MKILLLLPVFLSALLMSAHFLRAGIHLAAMLCLAFPAVLLVRRPWVARLTQLALVLAALEWVRTLLVLVDARQAAGEPWTRLATILASVTVFTGASALVFCCRSLRDRYGLLPLGKGDQQNRAYLTDPPAD